MHLAKRFHEEGIDGAARLIARLRSRPDTPISLDRVHRLIHRIFKISERRYTETAGRFNQLGTAWSDIMSAVQNVSSIRYVTSEIDDLFASAEEIDDDDD